MTQLTRQDLEDTLRELRAPGIGLQTWATLIGMVVTVLTIVCATLMFVFQTQTDALIQHQEMMKTTQLHLDAPAHPVQIQVNEQVKEKIEQFDKLDAKINAIGYRVGAGRQMRTINEQEQD